MKWVGWLMAACIIMALLQLAATVLAIGFMALLVWCAIRRPRETFAIASLLTIGFLAEHAPLALIGLAAVTLAACLIGKAME